MPAFVNPALFYAFIIPVVAAPVVIHLINLMRHRRVDWAAMEFLLASKKKNSTWIKLKELLLLLLRMLAVAAVVLIVAQPLLQNEFGRRFGGAETHHIVLLDDSFSMADRWGDTSGFEQAKKVVERIGEQASNQPTARHFTLLRFSEAAGTPQADLLKSSIDAQFPGELSETLRPLDASQLAVGPETSLEAIGKLLGPPEGENRVIYLVSDFRAKEWDDPVQLRTSLLALQEESAELHLVNCVDTTRPNLAITQLRPHGGNRAAGVPLFIEITVHNFGQEMVHGVTVDLEEDNNPRPALVIDEIAPGQSETHRFSAFFSTGGEHLIAARLQSDTVEADNYRCTIVNLPLAVPVLIIDPEANAPHGRFLAAALAPGGTVKTGIEPQIEMPSFLNNNPLDKFQAIYLANLDRLDPPAIEALEAYVQGGGGVGFFLGESTRASFFNDQLYREGQGMFPLPLVAETQLLVDRLEKSADMEVTDHPIFKVFAGQRNSFLMAVIVERYFSAPKEWAPQTDSTTRVLARLRNGAPLAVERKLGKGRVVAMMTTVAPLWNNWGRNPSFVVAMLEMQSYLAAAAVGDDTPLVGSPIELQFDSAVYQPRVRFVPPDTGSAGALFTEAVVEGEQYKATFPETGAAGVYELVLMTKEEQAEVRRVVLNVEPDEGDLKHLGSADLAQRLEGVKYTYRQASDFALVPQELAGSNISQWILYLLVLILVGEQVLAYLASYHPPAKEATR